MKSGWVFGVQLLSQSLFQAVSPIDGVLRGTHLLGFVTVREAKSRPDPLRYNRIAYCCTRHRKPHRNSFLVFKIYQYIMQ